jgi:hypothetical protein
MTVPERRLDQAAGVAVPAGQGGHGVELPFGEEAQQLELGVYAGLHAAIELEGQRVVEHHRAVRLLGAHRTHLRARPGVAHGVDPVELAHRVLRLEPGVAAHQVEQRPRLVGIGQRVVDGEAVGLGDHPALPAVRRRPQAHRQLVDLVRAGRETGFDQDGREQRLLEAQRHGVEHPDVNDLARLRAEPALRQDEGLELLLADDREFAASERVADLSDHRRRPPRPRRAGTNRSPAGRA